MGYGVDKKSTDRPRPRYREIINLLNLASSKSKDDDINDAIRFVESILIKDREAAESALVHLETEAEEARNRYLTRIDQIDADLLFIKEFKSANKI